jgi:hypothetical protein
MLAVPGKTLRRDLETALPASSGRGRPPRPPGQRVEVWSASRDESAWKRVDVRDGAKGPLARLSGHRLLTQQEDGAKPLTLLDLGLFCPAKNCIHNLSKALFLIFKGLTRF